jgi:hypothetical protein
LIGINTSKVVVTSANRSSRGAGLRDLCGIVTQDRVGATLYFAGEFNIFVRVVAVCAAPASPHPIRLPFAAQKGAFDLGAFNGHRQRYAA